MPLLVQSRHLAITKYIWIALEIKRSASESIIAF